jgi:hypothetical protein
MREDRDLYILDLRELSRGTPGITPVFGNALAEAASVCLENQHHTSGVQLIIDGSFTTKYILNWISPEQRTFTTWGDEEVTTEYGAYGIAFLLIFNLTDMTILERSIKGTGFDFWIGYGSEESGLFQNKARLEVSGIRQGNPSTVDARVKQKIKQIRRDNPSLNNYVIVVEFSKPMSKVITDG